MTRAYNAEMTSVECGDLGDRESLGDHDQAGIRAAEAEIGVRLDQLGDPPSVSRRDDLDLELARCHGTEERRFRGRARSADR